MAYSRGNGAAVDRPASAGAAGISPASTPVTTMRPNSLDIRDRIIASPSSFAPTTHHGLFLDRSR
jgi:hypothetical protein